MMTTVWAGVAIGSVYALIALSYNLSRAVSGALNFAVAHLMILSALLAFTLLGLGLPVLVVLVVCAVATGMLAIVEERVAIRPLRKNDSHGELVTTVGVATVLTGLMLLLWGPDLRAVRLGAGFDDPLSFLGGRMLPIDVVLVGAALLVGALTVMWSKHTVSGLLSRAQTMDYEAALLRGVNARRLSLWGFAVSGAVCGFVGPLVAAKTFAVASLPTFLAVMGFVALILGGLGSDLGAVLGGVLLGLVQAFASRYLDPHYQYIVPFVLFLLVLMVRPHGVLGRRETRLV
ncbi:branched-chain amino acid ABC transporter permease [Pseudonocardia xishanensis]|uniref:Branched-chain amino acid ABC transporter permease n=1 Tax=Pseudonocardia xishanensis TaxID=630995 RepID=A0ABP8RZK5_9PSEU